MENLTNRLEALNETGLYGYLRLFRRNQLAQPTAKAQRCRVDRDVDVRRAALCEALLHGVQDHPVLLERATHALAHEPRGLGIGRQYVAQLKPKITRGLGVDRRQEVVRVHDERAFVTLRLGIPGSCGHEYRLDQRMARKSHLVML